MNTSRPGLAVAAVLLLDALAHLYWLVRPAADPRALSMAVLGFEAPFTPPVLIPLILLLTVAALSVAVVATGRGGLPARLVTLAVGAGVLVRGELGLAWIFAYASGSPFFWLNLLLYTPLCLGMAVAVGIVLARSGRRSSGMVSTVTP